jgi:hypothetical protein
MPPDMGACSAPVAVTGVSIGATTAAAIAGAHNGDICASVKRLWDAIKHMIEFSKHKNLKIVQGQVLSENTTMLAMCAELGFHIADDRDDPGVKTVTLPVHIAQIDANFG